MGVAVVYGIVKQHRGFIEVHSSVSKGTTFKVYLPCVERDERKSGHVSLQDDFLFGSESIMVVEDDADIRSLMSDILTSAGYKVFTASNADEALKFMTSSEVSFDMLIADVVIPGINGAELSERIREQFPNIKTLLMTGYADEIIGRYRILERRIPFLEKPFDAKTVLRKVRETLNLNL